MKTNATPHEKKPFMVTNEAIVQKIDRTLKDLRLSRKRVAERIGVDQSYFQKMMTFHRPLRLDVVAAVAELLGMHLWELLKTDHHKPATHTLGSLEVPLVAPETLLRMNVKEIGMENVIDAIQVPRIALGDKVEGARGRHLVAVQLKEEKGKPTTIFVIDPTDTEPDSISRFLLTLGDAMDREFTVANLAGDLRGDELIAYQRHCLGPPVQVGRGAILGKVVWKMEYYL